jgi:hypothetical protein
MKRAPVFEIYSFLDSLKRREMYVTGYRSSPYPLLRGTYCAKCSQVDRIASKPAFFKAESFLYSFSTLQPFNLYERAAARSCVNLQPANLQLLNSQQQPGQHEIGDEDGDNAFGNGVGTGSAHF